MFGHKKVTPVSQQAAKPSQVEVAHTFDQTNGVMSAFDEYQSRKYGERGALDYDSDEQKRKLSESGAIGGMLGGMQ